MAKEKFIPIDSSDVENLRNINNKIREAIIYVSKILEENGIKGEYYGPGDRVCKTMSRQEIEYSLFRLDQGIFNPEGIIEIINFMSPMYHFDLSLLKLPNREAIEKFIHTDPVYEKAFSELKEKRYQQYLELKKEFERKLKKQPKEKQQ